MFLQEFFGSFSTGSSGFLFMWIITGMFVFAVAIAIERVYYPM
jgi:hypothetical protein